MGKEAKNLYEQVDLLKKRNMSFHDENSAMRFLSNVSYYRLKGYWWEMQDDKVAHHFVEGTYFEDVIARYNFDKRFRLIVFAAIEQRVAQPARLRCWQHKPISNHPRNKRVAQPARLRCWRHKPVSNHSRNKIEAYGKNSCFQSFFHSTAIQPG